MNLTEVYANNIGIKLPEKPIQPYRNFIPIPDEDYIVIESNQELGALNYDYFNEVVSELKKYGIVVAQIGSYNATPLHGAEDFRGRLTFSQTCYLIEHSKLLISGDTVSSYSANYLDVPTITLFGPTIATVNKPFYAHPRSVFIESDRGGSKASFNFNERPKTINLIKPEIIIDAALDILQITKKEKISTLFIGEGYPNFIFEAIPQTGCKIVVGKEAFINIRLDRNFDEQGAAEILNMFKSSIVTKKRFSFGLFNFKNLSKVIYQVDKLEDLDLEFVQNMESRNIDYQILTENKDILNDLKLQLFDFKTPILKTLPERQLDLIGKPCKSTRVLFANNTTYSSYWHYLNNEPKTKKMQNFTIPDTSEMTFWENRDSIYVYETEKLL